MDDAWVRLNRAKRGVESLRDAIETTDSSDLHGVRAEHDGKGKVRLVARVSKPPPLEWRLAVGDVLVDLRGALDYAVYYLAASLSAPDPPTDPRRIEFLVAKDEPGFARGRRKLAQIPGKAADYIESIQRYQPGHGGDTDALWVLNELVGINKHRFIPVFWRVLSDTTLAFRVEGASIEDFLAYKINGELKDGAVLATFRLAATQSNAKVEIQAGIATHIAFEPSPAHGMEVVTLLSTVGGAVESVIRRLADFA